MLKQNGQHTHKSCKTKWTTRESWMQFSNRCKNMKKCIVIIGESVPRRVCAMANLAASKIRVHSAIWTCCHNHPKRLPQHFHFSRRKIAAIVRCSNCRIWIWAECGVNWAMTSIWTIRQKRAKMVRHHRRPKIRWHWNRSRDSIECQCGWLYMDSDQRVITFGSMKCAQHWWLWKIALWFASIGRQERVCRTMCERQPIPDWWENSWRSCWKDCKSTKAWTWVECISLASVWAHTCPGLLAPICQDSDVLRVCVHDFW